MAIEAIQRFIYRNMVQRPRVSSALDRLGRIINKALNPIGLSYDTGKTRSQAALFVSCNPVERESAKAVLLPLGQYREPEQEVLEELQSIDFDFRFTKEIAPAVKSAVSTGLTPKQVVRLFDTIAKKIGRVRDVDFCYLPAAFEKAKEKLPPEQTADLFKKVVGLVEAAYYEAFQTLPAALDAGLTPEMIVDLFGKIARKGVWAGNNFYALRHALNRSRGIFNPEQMTALFGKFLETIPGDQSDFALRWLSLILGKIEKSLTPGKIIHFFEILLGKTGDKTMPTLSEVCGTFETFGRPRNIPEPAQMVDLLEQLVERTGTYAFVAIRSLPAALEANLSPGQIVDLFGPLFQGPEKRVALAFWILPLLLEGELTLAQIIAMVDCLYEKDQNSPEAKREIFKYLKDGLGITRTFLQVAEKFGLLRETALLLNDPATPQAQVERLLTVARRAVADSWSKVLNSRPAEELPRVFQFCARVMAEKALFAYNKVQAIASQTRKPTITVYVLSTAYKLKIERLSDQFREQGLPVSGIFRRIKAYHAEVREKNKAGEKPLEARLEVGAEWLKRRWLSRFTQPVFLKIPSGSTPSVEAVQALRELSQLAERNNYDIVFIDHSTVRTKEVVHQGDPRDFEKGRAIARALDIVDPHLTRRSWLYKGNAWEIPPLKAEAPNMIGLNLYDGQVYASHTGGQKSEWLPVDDHGEFVGVSWDSAGNKTRTDYLVITQNRSGKYHVYTAAHLFNHYLSAAVRDLRNPREKVRIAPRGILFVCNANHDRSPLAEHLMRQLIEERAQNAQEVRVASAGLEVGTWLAIEGTKKEFPYLPSSGTRKLLEQSGIGFQSFRKQQVNPTLVAQSDIIFVMTRREKRVVLERFPQAAAKVHVLREYAGYNEQDWDIPTPRHFNYQTRYLFQEALERALSRMAGEVLPLVRRLPKKPFRGRPYEERLAA